MRHGWMHDLASCLLVAFSFPNSCLGTHVLETRFRVEAQTRNRVSQTGVPKQEFGNEKEREGRRETEFRRPAFPNRSLGTTQREGRSFADRRSRTGVWEREGILA